MDALSNAPPLQDRLALDYEDLRAEIAHALATMPPMFGISIESDDDILAARDVALSLKALQSRVAAAFKAEKEPWLEGGRTCDAFFRALRVGLDATVLAITTQAATWQATKLAMAREKAAEEARFAAFLDEPPPEPAKPAAMTRVADGGAVAVSGAVRWDFEVVDPDALPRELLQVNAAAVKARVAGLKATTTIDKAAGAIPGVRIFEKIQATFR
jgi:hypothetical protein